MKKNIGIFLVMCIMLTACKNDKFPYDDELDDSEKNEISTEYDSLIDRKIANTKDEKINIGYDEALSEYEGYLDNVKLFEEDDFLQEIVGSHISEHIIKSKDKEWNEYCTQVTQWETKRYLTSL